MGGGGKKSDQKIYTCHQQEDLSPQKTIFFLNSTSTVFTLEAYIVQRAVLATEWEYLGEYSLT